MLKKLWDFVRQAVKVVHKLIMSLVHLKELAKPFANKRGKQSSIKTLLFGC